MPQRALLFGLAVSLVLVGRLVAGPLAHTYSIVAHDASTGQLGVAVQSHWFSVGAWVAWARAGVGAVATQAMTEPYYGSEGLRLLGSGLSPEKALATLTAADPARERRQVAMVCARGRVANHTGSKCIQAAGHARGTGFSVQANLMESTEVVPAMQRAFEQTTGSLADRMMAALEAAQEAGGDVRGRQSAGMIVVAERATGDYWNDRPVDIRVDDHPRPLEELRRLLVLQQAYRHRSKASAALERGLLLTADREFRLARGLAPDNEEFVFWHALGLARRQDWNGAVPLFKEIFAKNDRWIETLRRLPGSSGLPGSREDGLDLVETTLRLCDETEGHD